MKKIPIVISQEEFEKMFKVVRTSKHKNRQQIMLAMLLAFEAGMRISEILGYQGKKNIIQSLTKDQIDDTSIRVISGKGQRDRVIARPKRVNAIAIAKLPLTIQRRFLQGYITRLGKRVLDKHITFHTLRHGFATHYYNKTKDIRGLQQTLGHSRLDTTAIYAHTNPEETINKIREVFE
jgi:integrase/recombinase XerD